MSGFIMTMSSDDEAPRKAVASTSAGASKKSQPQAGAAPAAGKAGTKGGKLTRKQQIAAAKAAKRQARRHVDSASSGSDGESEGEIAAGSDGEGVGGIAADFHFDTLGGGFVGDRKHAVWDAPGINYATKKGAPRLTVDDIIARRAPERRTKEERKKLTKLLQDAHDSDDEGEEGDELEKEMMAALEEGGFGGDSEEEDEDEESGEGDEDDDELAEDDEEVAEGDESEEGSEEEDEGAEAKRPVEVDDGEDWLGLGEKESGDEDDEAAVDGEDTDAPSGFAALVDVEDEGSDDDDTPVDLREKRARSAEAVNPNDPTAAEAAAAKAYFTAHSNSTASSSTAVSFGTIPNANLSRQLLLALGSLKLSTPTAIQRECIPVAMMGKDIVASSATGSGKTVAFWVGVLERLLHRDRKNPTTRVVVMTPTRELAVQVHGVGVALARYTDIQFCLCVGGLSLKVQEAELKQRPDVVVSTPGRLIDHVRNTPCFTMDGVEILVLDEADRMLEEGFKAELEEIITAAPRSRQTLLFSATVTESIASLSRLSMNKPVRVKIDEMGAAAKGLVQEFLRVRGDKAGEAIERGFRSGERSREALLVALCTRSFASGRTIIFFRSKAQAHRMKIIFSLHGEGLERSDELHGDLTQEQRLNSLKRFREGESAFLLATDLASRGLDIKGIENVINYEMPKSIEIYLHRVGRTARAGKKGRALTLVGESDRKLVKLAMKHAPPESIRQRAIPPDVINEVSAELKELESEVRAVQREEKEEKEFRRGDMELEKGRNMLAHEAEIMSRPARTWFQTAQEKQIAKSAGLADYNGNFIPRESAQSKKRKAAEAAQEAAENKKIKRDRFAGLSRREKRKKQAALEDAEDREEGTTREIGASIRSAKKAGKPARMSVVAPEKAKGLTPKKKKSTGGRFDKELFGAAGPGAPRPKAPRQAGGSAGQAKSGRMGPKR